MGKSSLMLRTALRLRQEGFRVAILDLQDIGQNLTVDQWYAGLLHSLGEQFDLEDQLFDFWQDHPELGPLQRWLAALRQVVLPNTQAPVVISVDEIDIVRSLPFSTDEFFAGIRECYVRRAEDPELERLTFCLLGVATPSDLIHNVHITPFNIGRRIELNDFTEKEAAPLAQGLGPNGTALLSRILHWTGGHPYLTQRLCQVISDSPEVSSEREVEPTAAHQPREVDRVCEELFLTRRARETDNNLSFVRDRMLKSGADIAGLLELYRQVHSGQSVKHDEANSLMSVLRLSGAVRAVDGFLRPRNRIYSRAFGREWIRENMPDAELRRQRAAYFRGLARAAGLAALVLLVVSALAVYSRNLAIKADQNARSASRERDRALTLERKASLSADREKAGAAREKKLRQQAEASAGRERIARGEALRMADQARGAANRERAQRVKAQSAELAAARGRYESDMYLAQQYLANGDFLRAAECLKSHLPGGDPRDLRGFEWRYLWRRCHPFCTVLKGRHPGSVKCLDISREGNIIVSGGSEGSVRIWSGDGFRTVRTVPCGREPVVCVAVSPTGYSALVGQGKNARFVVLQTGKIASGTLDHEALVTSVAFSSTGSIVATGCADGSVTLWKTQSREKIKSFQAHAAAVSHLAFAPKNTDGRLASVGADCLARIWPKEGEGAKPVEMRAGRPFRWISWSPTGIQVVTGVEGASARIWDASGGAEVLALEHAQGLSVLSAWFSADGKSVLTLCSDGAARVWSVAEGNVSSVIVPNDPKALCAAYAQTGNTVVTGGDDGTLAL